MYSSKKFLACALIFAQLLGMIYGGTYDKKDRWITYNFTDDFPENAVLGGYDSYGFNNYVARVLYSSSILPARVRAETGYVTYNTDSVTGKGTACELLVSNETLSYDWIRSYDGYLEKNMVSVGTSSTNERVYVCRGRVDGGIFIGTLYLTKNRCFIRYENSAMRQLDKYEVLVRKNIPVAFSPFDESSYVFSLNNGELTPLNLN